MSPSTPGEASTTSYAVLREVALCRNKLLLATSAIAFVEASPDREESVSTMFDGGMVSKDVAIIPIYADRMCKSFSLY